jgi:hypothetical protein
MVQVPAVRSVTDEPVTEHTDSVADENDTGRPDDAVALTVTGEFANVVPGRPAKVIT